MRLRVSEPPFDLSAALIADPPQTFTPVEGHRAPAALPFAVTGSDPQASARAIDRLGSAMSSMKSMVLRDKLGRAIAALRADKIDEAAKLAVEFLMEEPENAMGLRVLANARERIGDFPNAFLAFQFAYNLDPKADGIVSDLGRIAYFMNHLVEAEGLFRAQLEMQPDDIESLNNLACALRDQLRLDEALEILRVGANAHPESELLWNNLGTVMSTLGDPDRALVFFDEAVRLSPEYAKAIYNRALLEMVSLRVRKIERGELEPQDFEIKGARSFLEKLHAAGVKLYLASGTDEGDVKAEAAVMGYEHLFAGGIHGAVGDVKFEAKRVILERIIQGGGLAGSELLVVGDGPVELREGGKRGALRLGIASNELCRHGLDLAKRSRLIRAGADYVISDFSQMNRLLPLLGL